MRERLEMDETKRDAEHQTRHTHILELKLTLISVRLNQGKLNHLNLRWHPGFRH